MYSRLEMYFRHRTSIDKETLAHICSHFMLLTTRRNEILLRQGEICKYYYFVNKGRLCLFTITKNDVECTRYFAFEGSFGKLIEETPAFEFIQTIEESDRWLYRAATFLCWYGACIRFYLSPDPGDLFYLLTKKNLWFSGIGRAGKTALGDAIQSCLIDKSIQ